MSISRHLIWALGWQGNIDSKIKLREQSGKDRYKGASVTTEMNLFFHPASIAVIGASNRKGGYQIIKNLLYGYDGAIYPVNPNYTEIQGIPCFPSLEDIPDQVDLAIIFVPAPAVPSVLEACAHKNITRVMIEGMQRSGIRERQFRISVRLLQKRQVSEFGDLTAWGLWIFEISISLPS